MNGIGMREASKKYQIPPSTLSEWARDGLIRILHKPERRGQAMLVLERDIAELAAHYVPGRSRWNRPALDQITAAS